MPVDKNSKDYKNGLNILVNLLSDPCARAVGNVIEIDVGSAVAVTKATLIGTLTRMVIGPEVEYDARHIQMEYAKDRTMPKEGETPSYTPFSNPDKILTITIGEPTPAFIDSWLHAIHDASNLAKETGVKLNVRDVPDFDAPGCLSAVPKAALDWVKNIAGKPRGNGGRGAN